MKEWKQSELDRLKKMIHAGSSPEKITTLFCCSAMDVEHAMRNLRFKSTDAIDTPERAAPIHVPLSSGAQDTTAEQDLEIVWAVEYIRNMQRNGSYGDVTITFQKGNVHSIKHTVISMKPKTPM